MKPGRIQIALAALLLAIAIWSLRGPRSFAAAPAPVGANTDSSSPAPTDTLAALANPSIESTATLGLPQVGVSSPTRCYAGPGTNYEKLSMLQPGKFARIIGKDAAANYWFVQMPAGNTCWLPADYASVGGDLASILEYLPPPSPTPAVPAAPSDLHIVFHSALAGQPSAQNLVHAELGWTDTASNETGYYVYRNGLLLATLGANQTRYADDTTMVAFIVAGATRPQLTYSIQAFNEAGKSTKVPKSVSCF